MQRNVRIALVVALAALSLFGCDKSKKTKQATGAQAPAIWSQLPGDAFFAMGFHRPEQTAPNFREALTKLGLFTDFYKEADFDDLQRDLGIDPFQPSSYQALGLDFSKGLAMGLDGTLLSTSSYYDEYAALVRIYKNPSFYWVAALSDASKFKTWLQSAVSKNSKSRLATEKLGELELLMVMGEPYSPNDAERVEILIVVRGSYVYAFFVNLQASSRPEAPDALAAFKKGLPDFFDRVAKPLSASPNFQKVARQLNANSDLMLYMDVATLASQYSALETREILYLTPTTEESRRSQDDERRYDESRKERQSNEFATIQRLGEAFPAFGMSAALAKDKASCEGYSLVGQAYQDDTRAVLTPSSAAPAYATLFPAGTGFIYRESVNLLALKRLVYRFFSPEETAEMNRGWTEISQASQGMLGLDLDKDLLGAFTGHLAFGAPDFGIAVVPFIPYSTDPNPKVPPAVMIAQLTSPAAGDKIISALQPMLDIVGVRTDTAEGEKMYYFDADGTEVAWARVNDLLLAALSREALKEMVRNAKKPGMSVVDKLPNELAKSLVTEKNATGCTADMGAFFSSLSTVGDNQKDKAMMYQLGSALGSSTMKITYESDGVQCRGDLLLK